MPVEVTYRATKDENAHQMAEIHDSMMSTPPKSHARESTRSGSYEKNNDNNFHIRELHIKNKKSPEWQEKSNLFNDEESSNNDSTDHDEIQNIKRTHNEESFRTQSHSRTVSPERRNLSLKSKSRSNKSSQYRNKQNVNNFSWLCNCMSNTQYISLITIILIAVLPAMFNLCMSEKHVQHTNNPDLLLLKSMKEVRAKFLNQESDIWNDISSAINEMISRTPKVPSIILLYANETYTLDCLAMEIACVSSTILHTDGHINLKPEDFGNDTGEIITELNEKLPTKKVVIIHDILSINAKAIRALHNLCDRINPLVAEAIYILTMQTNDHESSQKNLAFVEKQIYRKLSKNIDQDILSALVTRITDGAIIPVRPEPQLRYCT